MTDEIICTVCPIGCTITVEIEEKKIVSLTGNRCRRGIPYAEKEVIAPERVLTTTVAVDQGELPLVPVKTKNGIPRDLLLDAMRELRRVRITAPVSPGMIILRDICGTGIAVIATRTVGRKEIE